MKNLKTSFMGFGIAAAMLSACTSGQQQPATTVSGLNPTQFDSVINGKKTALFTLKNNNGMEVCITNFGGRVVSLCVPDKDDNPTDVVLGYDNIAQYADIENSPSDYGSSVGRYANRINQGKITIDGKEYQLPQNNFGHCLHGGPTGWMYQVYEAEQPNDSTLRLTIVSPDGDNGFPGTVTATTTYTVLSNNTLDITFEATTDKETVINMTNHSYFNLNGDPANEGMDMILYVNADNYTPADSTYMTTGEILSVEGTPMDFRTKKAIGDEIEADYKPLKIAGGYDHNFALDKKAGQLEKVAELSEDTTGRTMEVYTDLPGMQFYVGNFLEREEGKGGAGYLRRHGACFETQYFPDAVHKEHFEGPVVKAGETYDTTTVYRFYQMP